MIVARVTNDNGRTFNVRLVRQGERYGREGCLVHDKPDPLVEWYDATYEHDDRFDLGLGQFASRYFLSTLKAWRSPTGRQGIDLCGYVDAWKVTHENVTDVLNAIDEVAS